VPISTSDPRYIAEWVPSTISQIGTALRAHYGTGPNSFGAKGNTVHYSGFHRSENWIRNSPDSRYGVNDGSIKGSLNISQDRNAVSAFDFTPGSWGTHENRTLMVEITKRVHEAAKANDGRLRDLYEFAGTLDGSTVVTFYAHGGGFKTPFDRSHLDHVHGSIYRSRQLNSHQGIIGVMLGEGADVALTPAQDNALAETWATTVSARDGSVVGPTNTHPGGPNFVVESLRALLARPQVPALPWTTEQVADFADLVADRLGMNEAFLAAVANAVLNEFNQRSES
jgi:hypothetical protein